MIVSSTLNQSFENGHMSVSSWNKQQQSYRAWMQYLEKKNKTKQRDSKMPKNLENIQSKTNSMFYEKQKWVSDLILVFSTKFGSRVEIKFPIFRNVGYNLILVQELAKSKPNHNWSLS